MCVFLLSLQSNCHTQSPVAPGDYNTTVSVLQLSSAAPSVTVPVPLRTDGLFENPELFFAELDMVVSSVNVIVNPQRTNLTILDINGTFSFVTD